MRIGDNEIIGLLTETEEDGYRIRQDGNQWLCERLCNNQTKLIGEYKHAWWAREAIKNERMREYEKRIEQLSADERRVELTKLVAEERRDYGITYRYVSHKGHTFRDVGVLKDGSVHNPNGYPEDILSVTLLRVLEERRLKRNENRKVGAK